jgi:anti-sigma B factor antagonist
VANEERSGAEADAARPDGQRLRVTITRDADRMIVALDGDLDVYVASDARAHIDEAIERAVAHDIRRVILDASRIGFCDSTGLSTLVRASEGAAARGITLSMRELTRPMRLLLSLTGLDALLEPGSTR